MKETEKSTKICTKCKIEKENQEFYKDKYKTKFGFKTFFTSICKKCAVEKSKKWANENPEKERERKVKWAKENPESGKITRQKRKKKHAVENKILGTKNRNNLADIYIIDRLRRTSNLTREQIRQQPELIESTRTIIKIKRKIRDDKPNELSATC
jgi:hypothetical protein